MSRNFVDSRAVCLAICLTAVAACGQVDDGATLPAPSASEPESDGVASAATSPTTTLAPDTAPDVAPDTTPDTAPDDSMPAAAVPDSTPPGSDAVATAIALCDEVPVLVSDVIGDGQPNPDDAFFEAAREYGLERPEVYGGIWIDREAGGTVVVGFTDDPEPHRNAIDALADWDLEWDVAQVTYAERDLEPLATETFEAAATSPVEVVGSGVDVLRQRVSLLLAEPTVETIDQLASFVDVDTVCVEGPLLDPDRQRFEPGDPLDVIVARDADGEYPAGLDVGCGSGRWPLDSLLSATTLVEAGRDDLIDALQQAADEFGLDGPSPSDGWVILDETDETVSLYDPTADFISFVAFERTAGDWSLAGSSSGGNGCELVTELPEGLSAVTWSVDPAVPVDPAASSVEVLVTETSCTSGQEMGDRLLGPQLIETDTEVIIAFAAIALTGDQTCPDNPSTSVTVELDAPLGDRTIRDGRSTGLTLDDLVTG